MKFSILLSSLQIIVHFGFSSAYDTPKSQVFKLKQTGLVKGYYPTYNSKHGQSVSQIDYSLYTDLIFFAITPQSDFSLTFDPALTPAQGEKLAHQFVAECKKNKVNPLVSLGGWTSSRFFSKLSSTPESRKTFATKIVEFAKKYEFVGIEMDWEYPNGDGIGCNTKSAQDTVNFGLLTKEIRRMWPEASMSAAISINGLIGADGSPATSSETSLLAQNLDYVNIMAYDVNGPWLPRTGPVAPLYATCAPPETAQSVETGFQVALKQGFKLNQIVMGIPGYAKRLELSSPKLTPLTINGQTTYFYQNHTSTTPQGGKFDDKPGKDICGAATTWGGSFLTRELISNGWLSKDESTGINGYRRYFDECHGVPFLTNGKYFISYDDTQSTLAKAKWIKSKNAAGIFFFDTQGPTSTTVKAARDALQS